MAASFLGSLLVEIKGDNSDLDKSIKGSESSVKKFSKFAVVAYAAVGIALIAMGKKAAKAASNAEETNSKFRTVFKTIEKEAVKAADSFAESFGLARSTAQGLLGDTGDLLTGLGFTSEAALDLSTQVNTLAVDLASFTNFSGGASGASEALTKALLGEAESAKSLGIVINQNTKEYKDSIKFYTEVEGKTLLQAKAFTALDFATEQSKNAIGDYARTSESTANVMRRLEESQLALNEAIGVSINKVITPFASAMADLIKQLADARTKTNELKEALDIVSEGGITSAQQTLLILENQRDKLGQIAAAYEGLDEAANKAWQNAIRQVEDYNESLGITDIFLDKAATKEERRNAAIQGNNDAIVTYAQLLKDAMSDEELRLIQLNKEIDELVILKAAAKDYGTEWSGIETLLIALINEKNELLKEEVVIIDEVVKASDFMFDNGMVKVKAQSEAVKELTIDYEALANDGLGAFVTAFQMVGEEGVTAWDVVKQAGKDAISAILKGLGQQMLVESLRQFAFPLGIGIPSGIRFAAASAAAFAGAGLVQNLAEGGVIAPSGGGTPAIMGEAGVAEMAMPLTSQAINPFADAVASRISSTTNNNTQNFNSTFALSDDNKMREAARKLFPFMRDEEQRRGITI